MRKQTVFSFSPGKKVIPLLFLLLLINALFCLQTGKAALPNMDQLGQSPEKGKMVLLDFYSKYCSTCTAMSPYVNALSKKQQSSIVLKHLDVGSVEGKKYIDSYQIEGTPTYILFNNSGVPVYRMSDRISPLVLERQVQRLTHQLPPVRLPQSIVLPQPPLDGDDVLSNMILLATEGKGCTACSSMKPFLKGFEMAQKNHLKVIYVDVDAPEGKSVQKLFNLSAPPGYVLLDNSHSYFSDVQARGRLMTLNGKIEPKRFWNLIRLFSSDGLPKP
jgi:thiol-disulfide isomerase/thioredoxin